MVVVVRPWTLASPQCRDGARRVFTDEADIASTKRRLLGQVLYTARETHTHTAEVPVRIGGKGPSSPPPQDISVLCCWFPTINNNSSSTQQYCFLARHSPKGTQGVHRSRFVPHPSKNILGNKSVENGVFSVRPACGSSPLRRDTPKNVPPQNTIPYMMDGVLSLAAWGVSKLDFARQPRGRHPRGIRTPFGKLSARRFQRRPSRRRHSSNWRENRVRDTHRRTPDPIPTPTSTHPHALVSKTYTRYKAFFFFS